LRFIHREAFGAVSMLEPVMRQERPIPDVDAWLRDGGRVVAASERAARAIAREFHRARRAEGLSAWLAPEIADWSSWVRREWERLSAGDERAVMNPQQELVLWTRIVGESAPGGRLPEDSRRRMARMAAEAHGLLCDYAPKLLKEGNRSNWNQDQGAFSGWLTEFERRCDRQSVVSGQRLGVELLSLPRRDESPRMPLLLAGFDRMTPVQRELLAAWGEWHEADAAEEAEGRIFFEAGDEIAELEACAQWCRLRLESEPGTRILVVTQELGKRRGEIERAFLSAVGERFELSLGVSVGQLPVIRAAYLLLRWLGGSIEEHELDWLLGSGKTAANEAETYVLTGFLRAIRRRGLERTRWSLAEFMGQRPGVALPADWTRRMIEAAQRLRATVGRQQPALVWAELIPELLEAAGWPGGQALSSAEFQSLRRWQQALDVCASLGFDGESTAWKEFLSALGRVLAETLFAPESEDAPVQIVGPMESAGLTADAIWFMGASQQAWPVTGRMHPLIPIEEQREYRMPHATAQLDGELAGRATDRLVRSAREVYFSYGKQSGGVEQRASRLIVRIAGAPQQMPPELVLAVERDPVLDSFEDVSSIVFPHTSVSGGSGVVNAQSQCPFRAFATARLGAQGWGRAEAGLTAIQRGNLLHEVLHSVWGTGGVRTHEQLCDVPDLEAFVNEHVRSVLRAKMPAGVREWMPQGYLALEEVRLTRLVTEWLEFERTRLEFEVAATEVERKVRIKGLEIKLRLDRMDKLNDGKFLVIDYKSGLVDTKEWETRASDLQLPLYAAFALDAVTEPLGGLVFAQVRAGDRKFAGSLSKPKETLFSWINGTMSLGKQKLTEEKLAAWKNAIEELVQAFLDGRVEVDPIDPRKTCERCGLQSLCRIAEGVEDEEQPEDGGGEDDE